MYMYYQVNNHFCIVGYAMNVPGGWMGLLLRTQIFAQLYTIHVKVYEEFV